MAQRTQPSMPSQEPQGRPVVGSPTRRRLLGWSAGGGVALVTALIARAAGSERAQAQAPASIVGAWVISFPQGSGPGSDPNEHQLVTFSADGTMLSSNSPSSPPDPQQGPDATRTYSTAGQGAWVAAGTGQVKFKFMSVDTSEQGMFLDLVQITGMVTLGSGGNSFSGSFQIVVTGADGSVLFDSQGDAGTVVGTRILP